MNYSYDYAVMGGDMRQVYLARKLTRQNKKICYFALCTASFAAPSDSRMIQAASLEEACSRSACIICPIPLSRNGIDLNQSACPRNLILEQILSSFVPGQFFFAGCIPQVFRTSAAETGVRVFDLMEDASLTLYNTLATAEGAICEAIKRSPVNLHHSTCAVLGYGRCGSTLARYLKSMFCNLYVASGEPEELARAALWADRTGTLSDFSSCAGEFDFIFNTIPSICLTAELLEQTKPSITIIDIASAPGGLDFASAQKLKRNAVQCPGLPGRYAPASSAEAIWKTIEQTLRKYQTHIEKNIDQS